MSIYKLDSNSPTTTKIEDLNDMIIEVNGKVEQGKFNKYEIDQLYNDLGIARKYTRESTLGHTSTTYTGWSHLLAESGYSIWKYAISDYSYNANNKLYLDDKLLTYNGTAGAESATTFNLVYRYDGVSAYADVTTEAGTEGGTAFDLASSIAEYIYIGNTATFSGSKFEFHTQGQNYTNTVQYFNGSWTTLTATTNSLVDNTTNFTSDGVITWSIPTNWIQNSISGNTRYWIRIVTSTVPVTTAKAYYIIPYNSVPGILALSSSQIINEEWAWCSYGQNIYVTIRNSGNANYEGNYYITSSSSSTNKQNYFVSNHTYKIDYQKSSFYGDSVSTESGVAVGNMVCITDDYNFDNADGDSYAKRAVGCLQTNGVIRYTSGLVQDVNTVAAGNIVAGNIVYLSQTAGKVSKTAPVGAGKIQQKLGIAVSDEHSGGKVDIILQIDLYPTVL